MGPCGSTKQEWKE